MSKRMIILVYVLILQGCSGVFLAPALMGSYMVGSFESVSDMKNNRKLQKKITKELNAIKKLNEEAVFKVDVLVYDKGIYIIGSAKDAKSKHYVLSYVSSRYKTKKIIDEIKVPLTRYAMLDYYTRSKIKTKLVFTNGVRYSNYNVYVYGGDIILIGAAHDKYESSKVLDAISSTRGVKKIINYVEVKDIGD